MGHPYYKKGKAEGRWVMAVEDKRIFDSISAAARAYGVTRGAIQCALRRGVRAGGTHWKDVPPSKIPGLSKTPWAKGRDYCRRHPN